jgi:hypothetical protein
MAKKKVKFFFYDEQKPRDEGKLRAITHLAYQAASSLKICPRAIFVRSVFFLSYTSSLEDFNGPQAPDGVGIVLKVCGFLDPVCIAPLEARKDSSSRTPQDPT